MYMNQNHIINWYW